MLRAIINLILNILKMKGINADGLQNWWNDKEQEKEAIKATQSIKNVEFEITFPVKIPRITSPYGWRRLVGKRSWHNGVDYSGRDNPTARAPFNGIITKVVLPDAKYPVKFKWSQKDGRFVSVKDIPKGRAWTPYIVIQSTHNPNLRAILRHVKSKVTAGTPIEIRQEVASIGNYGYCMGAHLHYEIQEKKNGKWKERNPHKFTKDKMEEV